MESKNKQIGLKRFVASAKIVILVLCIISCTKDDSCDSCTGSNQPPTSIAGPDQTLFLPFNTTNLNGNGSSDPNNDIISYEWKKIFGPSAYKIVSPNAAQTQLTDLVEGDYLFELKVTDATGLISKDSTTVRVWVNVLNDPNNLSCNSNTTSWSELQQLPSDEFFFAPRYWFNGDNFLFGVNNEVFAVSNKGHIWKYNFSSNDWVMIGDFIEGMSSAPIVFSLKGKAFFIGRGHCWQYDPVTGQWSKKKDPPGVLEGPLVSDNSVYFRYNQNQIVEFNPDSDTYTLKDYCSNQALLGWFFVNGSGYYIYENKECWKYNPATDSWQQKGNLNIPGVLHSTSSFTMNSYGYIIGDYNAGTYNENLPMKLLRYDPELDEWTNCPANDYTGYGAYYISTVSFNEVAYIGLGYNNADFNATDFWRFE